MVEPSKKQAALDVIHRHIDEFGHHVYVVAGGSPIPRFAYTIGVSERLGSELILAGAAMFCKTEVLAIIDAVANAISVQPHAVNGTIAVKELGTFTLRPVDPSWSVEFIFGAFDFYGVTSLPALQILPDEAHWTADIPDLEQPWSAATAGVWKWLKVPWGFPVPPTALVTTNLGVLRGDKVIEVMRWEQDSWEMFSREAPEIPEDEIRVVQIGTMLVMDRSLEDALHVSVGKGLWRDADDHEWNALG